MAEIKDTFIPSLSNAPHIKTADSISKVMWTVVIALLPVTAYGVSIFGLNSLLIILVSVAAAVASETAFQILMKRKFSAFDGSAVLTGLLVALNVPPAAPAWVAGIGSVFAIIIVKQLFGGLGYNIFNPALAARAFMMASWPTEMTTKWHKFSGGNILSPEITNVTKIPHEVFDIITQATPLSLLKEGPTFLKEYNIGIEQLHDLLLTPEMLKAMFVGNAGGVIGETSALLILIGGIFMMIRKVISWHIPLSYIGTMFGMTWLYYYSAGFPYPELLGLVHIISGGLFLGAFFMATDMVTSPVTARGKIIFGIGCGVLTFTIRIMGGYPEGVSYAILLMNSAVPLLDRLTRATVFGYNIHR
jgi:electron transport complex protein RnfD